MPGYLLLHLKLLYDRGKGIRDDQDHDPNAWNGDFDAKKDGADEDADDGVDDVDIDGVEEDADAGVDDYQ